MSTFFNIIEPIANLPVFIVLNLIVCSIAIHWYWTVITENFSEKLHRNLQRLGLFISILIIGILFVKQWNIGDLLAFYSIFSFVIMYEIGLFCELSCCGLCHPSWQVSIHSTLFVIFFIKHSALHRCRHRKT